MDLSRLNTPEGPRWALDGRLLPFSFDLRMLLELPANDIPEFLRGAVTAEPAPESPLPPIEATQEVWASGVTFLRSREARAAESAVRDVYERVYSAERPELFFKAAGWRVIGPGGPIRIRADSAWNVPEPELTLVINSRGEICGFCAGNDVSSRSIEGENPLYLPQAKVYNGSCALGPSIRLVDDPGLLQELPIRLQIERGGKVLFHGETSTRMMKRRLPELVAYLFRELDFPAGVFLMTGTGIVPPEEFSLIPGDSVQVQVNDLLLSNITA